MNFLSVTGGVRGEKFEGLDWDVTPRLGAVVRAADGRVALRGSLGRAFKAPNIQQQFVENPFVRANPDLRPETSLNIEGGIDFRSTDGRGSGSLTVFRQTFDDLIRTVGIENEQQQINRNLGAARAMGVEWSLRYAASPSVSFGTDGAWIETEIEENSGLSSDDYPVGGSLPFRPEWVGAAHVDLGGGGPTQVRLRVSRVGPQDVLANRFGGPRARIAGYTLVGGTLSYDLTDSVRGYVRADNVLGTDYFTAFDRAGAPPTGMLGLEIGF